MSLSVEIQKKQKDLQHRRIMKSSEVFKLEEVQEIKDAIREHLLFIGLDSRNNIRNISLLGMGTSRNVSVDGKDIVRTALVTASEKVILVHNHPSNGLQPSDKDIYMTNITRKLLEVFNVELVDHIIVAESDYISTEEIKLINKDYEDEKTKIIDNAILIEENKKLKENIKILTDKLQEYQKEAEEEFE